MISRRYDIHISQPLLPVSLRPRPNMTEIVESPKL